MTLLTRTSLRINIYCSMADFPFFKMAAVRHLGFLKVGNFNFRSSLEVHYASSCQISQRLVEPFWRYSRFSIIKMSTVRHLEFLKVVNFDFWSGSEDQFASPCQISQRSVEPFRTYGRFSIFQDGGRPPSWICSMLVGTTHEEYLVVFVTVQNLVVIGAVISIVCKF